MNGAEASAGRESERDVRMELLLHMPALEGPVRGLAWVPPEVATAAGDGAHRHLFATVGHSDKLRFWDSRRGSNKSSNFCAMNLYLLAA